MSANAASMAGSHGFLLEKTGLRHPRLPMMLHRLSKGGFYLYLAQECQRRGSPGESHRWWWRAAVEGRPFPLLRPAFYTLAMRNAIGISGRMLGRLVASRRLEARRVEPTETADTRLTDIEEVAGRRASIWARILLQDMLHYAVSRMPTP